METLLYPEEHHSCLNYCVAQSAEIRLQHFPQGTCEMVDTSLPTLIFVLEGAVLVTTDNYHQVLHTAGHFSLLARNSAAYVQVLEDCTSISCQSPRDVSFCDRFSMQQLPEFLPEGYRYEFNLLPIRPRLQEYLHNLRHLLEDGLGEFAELANTSIDTFKRRFKEAFGEPAYKWMTRRKAEHVYRDLALTTKSIADIAEQFHFSSIPYLTTFCKQHLGKTPQQIRNEAHAGNP